MELKFKKKEKKLNEKYEAEILRLQGTIEKIEGMFMELNQEKVELNEALENGALREESLNRKVVDM